MRRFHSLAWTILLGGFAMIAAARSTIVERSRTVEIHGWLFDVSSKPIAGATVTVVRPGEPPYSVITNAKGEYDLSFETDPRIRSSMYGVIATAGDDRVAVRPLILMFGRHPGPKDARDRENTMVAKQATVFDIDVVADGKPLPGAAVGVGAEFAGTTYLIASGFADDAVRFRVGPLPEGGYSLRILDSKGRCGDAKIELPAKNAEPLRVELHLGRSVSVTLTSGESAPVGDVPLHVARTRERIMPFGDDLIWIGEDPVVTDDHGRAVLIGLPVDEELAIKARSDLGTETLHEGEAKLDADALETQIELRAIEVQDFSSLLEELRSRLGTDTDADESGPRSITLTIVDETGAPLRGMRLQRAGGDPFAMTGVDGGAVLKDLPAESVYVEVVDAEHDDDSVAKSTFDLTTQDAMWNLSVAAWRSVVLHVRIDGEPRVPAGVRLIDWTGRIRNVEEDRETGTIRFLVRPDHPGETVRMALDSATNPREEIEFEPGAPGSTIELTVELGKPSTLKVTVIPAESGRHMLGVQRFDDQRGEWRWNDAFGGRGVFDRGGAYVLENLPAGRYRVGDQFTGLVFEPFDLPGPDPIVERTLDLSSLTIVRGRVRGPPGAALDQARIDVECEGLTRRVFELLDFPAMKGWRVKEDGSFEEQLPKGRTASLRVRHPNLTAVPGKDVVSWDGSSDAPLEFELQDGAWAELRTNPPVDLGGRPLQRVTVLLFQGPAIGEPVSRHEAIIDGDRLRFGGFAPGEYTAWLDTPPLAPLVIEKLRLEDGDRDYGTYPLSKGATIRFKLKNRGGGATPVVMASVKSVGDGPRYTRVQHRLTFEPDALFPGLLSGTFEVEAGVVFDFSARFRTRVESTGEGEIVIELPY